MSITDPLVSEIIAMAWDDKTSFDAIQDYTGLSETGVISLMKKSLKPSSFRLWRKRVEGRKLKHERKNSLLSDNQDKLLVNVASD